MAGGVSPYRSLPIGLDVGTDRQDLLDSPAYLGLRQKRLRGAEYLALTDQVVDAIRARWPRAVVQWEDLSKDTAFDVLDRYRKRLPSFNDDIQGTGAVALAGLVGACSLRGRKLRDEVVVVYGAGAGGAGVAWAIAAGNGARGAHARRGAGARLRPRLEGAARRRARDGGLQALARAAAARGWPAGATGRFDLAQTIEKGRATVLLGLSGQPSTFTEPMVRALCANVERPVVFPLSNPTSACEATPEDLLAWSHGRAIVATGSPFAPVRVGDRDAGDRAGEQRVHLPRARLRRDPRRGERDHRRDGPRRLRTRSPTTWRRSTCRLGLIYPPVEEMSEVAKRVATRVIQQAFDDGVACTRKTTREGAEAYVRAKFWRPAYLPFVKA